MSKKISLSILMLVGVVAGGLIFKQRVGDIRPALLPPKQPIEAGDTVGFPVKVAEGFKIGVFAPSASTSAMSPSTVSSGQPNRSVPNGSGQAKLDGARDLEFSPAGTLLVSSTKQGKVFVARDRDKQSLSLRDRDGRAEEVKAVLSGLNRPHGLAFWAGKLFVAEETRVVRYLWDETSLTAKQDKVLFSLPASQGGHFTRSLAFDKNGRLFVSIGSTCNVCQEKHGWHAAIIVSDADGNNPRLFAKGLRNSVFMTINPQTGELWVTEMGRDFLGDNLPPDEINIVREGSDYGWPFCYGVKVPDQQFLKQLRKESPCEASEAAAYEIAAHSAPLGLVFVDSPQFPKDWQGDLLVSYHGSWNRSTPIGYKIVRLKVDGDPSAGSGQVVVGEEDFITGFISSTSEKQALLIPAEAEGGLLAGKQAYGRPVDLTFDQEGSLYISDDKAGVIYKVVRR